MSKTPSELLLYKQQVTTFKQMERALAYVAEVISRFENTNLDQGTFNHVRQWVENEIQNVESFLQENPNDTYKNHVQELKQRLNLLATGHQFHTKLTQEQQQTHSKQMKEKPAQIQTQHDAFDKHVEERSQRIRQSGVNLENQGQVGNLQGSVNLEGQGKVNLQGDTNLKNQDKFENLIDEEMQKLSEALYQLQIAVPALSTMAKHMAQAIAEFQLSSRDTRAFSKLNSMLLNQEERVKDPMATRVWHYIMTTFKAFLSLLDSIQAKVTGSNIDKPHREHLFKTPQLPVHEAKTAFRDALDKMHDELELIVQHKPAPNK